MNLGEIETQVAALDTTRGFDLIYDLFEAYGLPKASIKRLKSGSLNKGRNGDELLWRGKAYYRLAPDDEDLYLLIDAAKEDPTIKRRDSFSFLLDMNRLFEQFMHKLLERIVQPPDVVHYQRSDPSIVRDSQGRPYSRIIPDLLVKHGDRRVPIDAKYKRYDDWKVAVSDITQTFLYSYAYAGPTSDAGVGAIVYPSTTHAVRSKELSIWGHGWGKGSTLHIVSVPIPELLADIRAGRRRILQEFALAMGLSAE